MNKININIIMYTYTKKQKKYVVMKYNYVKISLHSESKITPKNTIFDRQF